MTPAAGGPGDQIRLNQAAIADELVRRQFGAEPELARRYGAAGREKCRTDANYHLAYLADAMNAGDPALFRNYVGWAKVMLGKRGVPMDDLARYLELTRTIIRERFTGAAGTLASEYLSAGVAAVPSLPADLTSCLVRDAPHGELARAYLDALLKGERHAASQMILDAVSSKVSVKDIYQYVFQPAQYEVGQLWQVNEISVAQEHYCTAATQMVMSQLYPLIFASEKNGRTFVATCVAGDLHEVGLRMVADFFEIEGWNTYYLGANMPPQSVVDTVVQQRAEVLGISATILFHLRAVSDLIRLVRDRAECRDVKILVGGYPFLISPDLWRTLGADGSATNAQAAETMASGFVQR